MHIAQSWLQNCLRHCFLHCPFKARLLQFPFPNLESTQPKRSNLYKIHLDEHSLRTVCKATTTNRILYAGPASGSYADEADRTRIGQFMRRLLKAGFTSAADGDIDASISSAELKQLNGAQSKEFHVLRSLFPNLVQHKYSLRRRVHSFMLPCKDDENFISRVLLRPVNLI